MKAIKRRCMHTGRYRQFLLKATCKEHGDGIKPLTTTYDVEERKDELCSHNFTWEELSEEEKIETREYLKGNSNYKCTEQCKEL